MRRSATILLLLALYLPVSAGGEPAPVILFVFGGAWMMGDRHPVSRVNGHRYGLDPDRIGLWGPSAGGHLVALAGTSGDALSLDRLLSEHPEVSTRVQTVVDYFGPTDLS